MEMTTIVNKLKSSVIIILAFATSSAYAEYYMVYPVTCGNCSRHVVKYHVVKKHYYKPLHRRYIHRSCHSYGYTAWYPRAVSRCAVAVPACDNCGVWRPDNWRAYDEGYYYTEPDPYYGPSYDPDLSTGDDNACINPEMDIDNY